jgi:hypothetical protein
MTYPAPDHCIREADHGCGCSTCVAWRKALAAFRAVRDAARRGAPIQQTCDLRSAS